MNNSMSFNLKAKTLNKIKFNLPLTLLSLPAVIYLIMFNFAPMFGVIIAFKDYKYVSGIYGSNWVGFKYFKYFFESNDAARTIFNTVSYSVWFLIVGMFFQILVAIFLYELTSRKALKFYQTSIVLPSFVSWVLVAYIGFSLFSSNYGVLNIALENLGMHRVDWYQSPEYWPVIMTIATIWKNTGMSCIIYYAAFMGLDTALIEAGKLDGASRFQRIIHIMLPSIYPIICMMSLLAVGNIMSGDFGLFLQVPMNSGALYPTTDIINTYVYRGLQHGNISQTAAVGLFQSVVGLILVLSSNLFIRKVSPDNALF